MKFLIPLLTLATITLAQGVESVPSDHAQRVARMLTSTLGAPADAPFATEVDTEKAAAIKAGDVGALAMPDKKLTAEALAAAGAEPVAAGQLWMRNVVPAISKAAPSNDKLRTLTVKSSEDEAKVEVYFLAVTKGAAGLELSLFAKEKSALLKVPLVKTDAPVSSTAFALDGHKDDDSTGTMVLTVFGTYKADITVTKPRE